MLRPGHLPDAAEISSAGAHGAAKADCDALSNGAGPARGRGCAVGGYDGSNWVPHFLIIPPRI